VLLVHVLVTALITFSNSVTILETVPVFRSLPGGIWFGIETSLVALFTVEYVTQQTFWIRLLRQPSLTIMPNANC
jgi:potassium voltage-gated channel Shal-related subfamily D protein 2